MITKALDPQSQLKHKVACITICSSVMGPSLGDLFVMSLHSNKFTINSCNSKFLGGKNYYTNISVFDSHYT